MKFLQLLYTSAALWGGINAMIPSPEMLPSKPDLDGFKSFKPALTIEKPVKPSIVQARLKNGDNILGYEKRGVESYRGIPFVEPPVGDMRFKHSVPFKGSLDGFEAFDFGPACYSINPYKSFDYLAKAVPLVSWKTPSLLDAIKIADQAEDCLTINVYRPAGIPKHVKLPVMVWTYGGAFQIGSSNLYPGDKFIRDSVTLGEPVVFVTFNYRLGPWGFLGGEAIGAENSTNPAIYDIINAFNWVKENIGRFNGDKNRITAFGESSGAMLLSHIMTSTAFNEEDPLFHAAILQSGGILPLSDAITSNSSNDLFLTFSEAAGCGGLSDQTEALSCLRTKDEKVLYQAQTYDQNLLNFFDLPTTFTVWGPKPDGILWEGNSFKNVRRDGLPNIPIITGNQEDEGTLISLFFLTFNSTATDEKLLRIFPNGGERLNNFLKMYPDIPSEGAPFRTGDANELWPNFKRLSALLTDIIFTIPRRVMLRYSEKNRSAPTYTFWADNLHNVLPYLGTTHASCLIPQFYLDNTFPSRAYRDYFISFANHYNPNTNNGGLPYWPKYTNENLEMLHIMADSGSTRKDDFRRDRTDYALGDLSILYSY
ncbi:uncharacterized protein SAPINGB_P004108 [Magnusiomyces paraingens]|uniref:Carboxylesterase type B domain-containing protein n=1 Tax=Magnusiomyces paraingens TaxID=2606893 RepID=A0A5E8BST2_9ASCO|nr:uncharacterized protein SAPINGB_P004108 [Saprochaete ingens]VVT54503.1 unnamed protein product [Saprochaete ingens]